MSGLQPPLPPPPDEKMSDRGDNCRLWVGNLDTRITEFTLLKLLQKYGSLDKFDFLYHKSGPDQGKPRGYCFVSYHSPEEASRAIQGLNGKLALSKKLIVRWAHADRAQEQVVMKHADGKLPVQCTAESKSSLSKESKIRLIEAKLKMMESSSSEFKLTNGNVDSGSTGCPLDKRKGSAGATNSRPNVTKSQRTADKPYSRVVDSCSEGHSTGSSASKR